MKFPYIYPTYNIYTQYIKILLRKDLDFIFSFLLYEYGNDWQRNKKIKYKNISFSSYIEYLIYLCMEKYKATKCRNKIYKILGNKYKNKKTILFNNEWNN